jgi:hypothetical protein
MPTAEDKCTMTLPGPDDALSFESNIKGLFRVMDRNTMQWAFDLWNVDDVRQHAPAILARLRAGDMPCDGEWPADRIGVFERWVDAGMPA